MQILRVKINNLRGLADTDIDAMQPATALFGLNGAGKSSFLAAIRMALYGWCEFTDRRGAGAAKLIADGARSAEIAATLQVNDHALTVNLTISRRDQNEWCVLDAPTGEVLEDIKTRADLWAYAGIDLRHALVAGMPDLYLGTSDLDGALAQFMSGNLQPADVFALCGEYLPWLQEFVKGAELTTADHFAAVGKRAYERRTELNREVKTAKMNWDQVAHLRAPRDSEGTSFSATDVETLTQSIDMYQRDLDALHIELGRAQSAPAPGEREQAEQALREAQDAQGRLKASADATRGATTAADDALTAAKQADASAVHVLAQQRDAVEQAKRSLAQLASPDGACPTCKRKYTAKDKTALLAPLEKLVQDAEALHVQRASGRAATLAALEDAHETHGQARTANEDAQAALSQGQRFVAKLAGEVQRLSPEHTARPEAEVQADIDTVTTARGETQAILAELNDYLAAQQAEKYLYYLEAQAEPLNWAVTAFRDGEIIKQCIQDEMGAFIARCNRVLKLFGFAIDIEVAGKKVAVLLRCPGREFRPVDLCSNGERMLASFALASAFADTGAPILLDNLNELDHQVRKGVLLALRERAETSSVLVAAAWQQSGSDMDKIAAALAPVTVVWAEDGQLTVRGDALVEA